MALTKVKRFRKPPLKVDSLHGMRNIPKEKRPQFQIKSDVVWKKVPSSYYASVLEVALLSPQH